MDWDVDLKYNTDDYNLIIDMDKYFSNFPDIKTITIKILGKEYKVDRLTLSRMMETLESI